jgi:hypothetical protein
VQSLKKPSLRVWNKNISIEELKFQMEREKQAQISANTSYSFNPKSISGFKDTFKKFI